MCGIVNVNAPARSIPRFLVSAWARRSHPCRAWHGELHHFSKDQQETPSCAESPSIRMAWSSTILCTEMLENSDSACLLLFFRLQFNQAEGNTSNQRTEDDHQGDHHIYLNNFKVINNDLAANEGKDKVDCFLQV